MKTIPIELVDGKILLDFSNFIPALSKAEVLSAFDEVLPLLMELLQTQLIWRNSHQSSRDRQIYAYLALDMVIKAHVAIAVEKARIRQAVIQGTASIKDHGFPEFEEVAQIIE